MNALEFICRVGVSGKNVPDSLERIVSPNITLLLLLTKLKVAHKDYFATLASSQTYDEFVDFDGDCPYVNEYEVNRFFGLEEDEDEVVDDEEAIIIQQRYNNVQDFIELLRELCEWELTNVEINFENKLIEIE